MIKLNHRGKITEGQDGGIFSSKIFRFNEGGHCTVHSLSTLEVLGEFTVGGNDIVSSHSNSVSICEIDGKPLIFTNVYNNYSSCEDKMLGVCCVYELTEREEFSASLVGIIKVGFTDDIIWRSENTADVRPYGNFAVDGDFIWVFVMRDEARLTRIFKFRLPEFTSHDEKLGVPCAVLEKSDIIEQFDVPYMNYMQGACISNGILYSLEGFGHDHSYPPAIRLIDLAAKKEISYINLVELGYKTEPEFISEYRGKIYYSDAFGDFYELDFEI